MRLNTPFIRHVLPPLACCATLILSHTQATASLTPEFDKQSMTPIEGLKEKAGQTGIVSRDWIEPDLNYEINVSCGYEVTNGGKRKHLPSVSQTSYHDRNTGITNTMMGNETAGITIQSPMNGDAHKAYIVYLAGADEVTGSCAYNPTTKLLSDCIAEPHSAIGGKEKDTLIKVFDTLKEQCPKLIEGADTFEGVTVQTPSRTKGMLKTMRLNIRAILQMRKK